MTRATEGRPGGWGSRGRRLVCGLLMVIVASACTSVTGESQTQRPDAEAASRAIVDLWRAMDRTYAWFPDKPAPWDLVGEVYRSRAENTTSQEELFDLGAEMLALLDDNHIKLISWTGVMSTGGSLRGEGAADDFSPELIRDRYLVSPLWDGAGGRVTFGWLPDSLGYVRLASMYDIEATVAAFEEALSTFEEARGLVLDLRVNLGGAHEVGQAVASLLADRPRRYMVTQLKRGPGRDDFTRPKDWLLTPPPGGGYVRPVAVLMAERTFSAGETFLLALRVLPHVVTVGTRTSGSMGETENEILPNGWVYRTDMQRSLDAAGRSWAGIGIQPDLRIDNTAQETRRGRDRALEASIAVLSHGRGSIKTARRAAIEASLSYRLPLADSLGAWIDADGLQAAMERFHRARSDTSRWSLPEAWESGDLTTLGRRLLGRDEPGPAAAVLEEAMTAYPESYRPHYVAVEAYERLGRTDRAARARRRAIELNEGLFKTDRRALTELSGKVPLAHRFFDWVFESDRVSEEGVAGAVRRYRALAARRPDAVQVDSMLLVQIGQQIREVQQYGRAEAVFTFITEEFPRWAMGHLGVAVVAAEQNDRERAADAYRRVLEIDPDNQVAREGLAALTSWRE